MEIFKTGIRLCHRSLIVISTCRTIGLSYRAVFQPRGLIVGAGKERGEGIARFSFIVHCTRTSAGDDAQLQAESRRTMIRIIDN